MGFVVRLVSYQNYNEKSSRAERENCPGRTQAVFMSYFTVIQVGGLRPYLYHFVYDIFTAKIRDRKYAVYTLYSIVVKYGVYTAYLRLHTVSHFSRKYAVYETAQIRS